ncbi:MAG: helix-turn-helix domain-containing protein [Pseudomonadales bacterium]|nr:helix-turn-helix domain-containing protein [Pseudomonadales bacterium]
MTLEHLSDHQILRHLGGRFKAIRLNQDITVESLAEQAGVSAQTIANLENGKKSVGLLNIIAILRALGKLGELDAFLPEPPTRAAALLRQGGTMAQVRQRASGHSSDQSEPQSEPWSWEDE